MLKPKALLISYQISLLQPLPQLFSRAGFEVELLASFKIPKNKFISSASIFKGADDLICKLDLINLSDYKLIIPCDDGILGVILDSNLSAQKKVKLLSITNESNLVHICSKIGLSKILRANDITTPDFFDLSELGSEINLLENLSFPLLLKIDRSSGGSGVFEAQNLVELKKLIAQNSDKNLLIQKKIDGKELDLTALFFDQKLIGFSYVQPQKFTNKFGPSSVRIYTQLSEVERSVFLEIEKIGKALGANGFVNLSAIKSSTDNKLYFFEADMRPNAWSDYGKFIGDDLAIRISDYFKHQQALNYPQKLNPKYPKQSLLSLPIRLKPIDILTNNYNAWRFISKNEIWWFCVDQNRKLKQLLRRLNRVPTSAIHFFFPDKVHRQKIKLAVKNLLNRQKNRHA